MLVVARTPAALSRLNDVVPLISEDSRIEVTFAVDGGSVFSAAATEQLTSAGARIVAWSNAVRETFDLALAASDNGKLHRVRAPLLVLPHGAGYHRHSPTDPEAISGLRGSTLVHHGRPVPHTLVVAHPDQVDTVRNIHPALARRTLVAGDPCLDRIAASSRSRHRYRRAFHSGGRSLVVLCSTWGPSSLFGRFTDLPRRLTSALPVDQYQTVLVLHPNIWERHGALQIQAWLRAASDAGLIVLAPEEGWRAALVAADLVISDHGSLTCYAVAAGRPVLLATDGGSEVVRYSPLDDLRQQLPALDHDIALRGQIDSAIAAGQFAVEVTEGMFSRRGTAAATLRTRMYEILGLTEPPHHAVVRPVPVPTPLTRQPDALHVSITAIQHHPDHDTLHVERYPASDEPSTRIGHLVVGEHTNAPGLLERGAVIWSEEEHPTTDAAADWGRATLEQYPGARVVVAAVSLGGVVASVRDGRGIRRLIGSGELTLSLAGSAIYHWALMPNPDRPEALTVHAGQMQGFLRLQVEA